MLNELRVILGDKGLITSPAEMEPWLTDWRQRVRGQALCVASPASTDEVAAVLALCAREEQPVFPVGGNTGLCFGAVPCSNDPARMGIVLSLRRMTRIRAIDDKGGLATVDAGVVLATLHEAAAGIGKQFPLYLGSEGTAQIGGLISTNAGGTGAVRYGTMRDLVAGLEIVLADGRVLSDLAGLRKNNTGYMLRQLFIGAEGTLGIITGAVVRLFPKTLNTAHAWVSVRDPEAGTALLAAMQARAGSYIHAFELVSASQVELVRRHIDGVRIPLDPIPAWSVLIELAAEDTGIALDTIFEEIIATFLESGAVEDALIAASEQQAADFWKVRHSSSEANKREGIGIVHDISVRTADVPAFIAAAEEVAAERYPQAFTETISHLGDGNIHYILMFQREYWNSLPDPDGFALEVERAIHDVAASMSGSISAEHGIGRKLPTELRRLADPLQFELMTKLKAMFDPKNLLNPGVLFTEGP